MKKELKPNSMSGSSSKGLYNIHHHHPQQQQQQHYQANYYEVPSTLDTPSRNTSTSFSSSNKLNSYLTPDNDKFGTSSPPKDRSYASILPISGSKVDLSEELASQIEYNNALLKELQTMERKVQDLNKELSLKDQELRNSSQEKFSLQNKIDKLQGELYNAQFIVDRIEHENDTIKEQLENSKRKNQELQNEIKENLDKLEISAQQLSERNSHTKDLEHELNILKDKCDKSEEEITNLHFQIDDYTNQLVNEKNQYIDLQKQYDQEREDFMSDIQRLTEDIEKLKRELSLSDKERDKILFDKDLAEKKIYDIETQLESQTIQINEKLRKSNEEYDHLMKQFKQLSQEYSSLKTIHYKYLGDVQNELRDLCSSMVNVKDRYSLLSQQVRDAQNFSKSLLSIENSQTEVIVNEMKTLIEERSKSIGELQMVTDQYHSLEVKLEEEKSRSIMFEERSSKYEQQLQDLQQKVKFTEREMVLKQAQQAEKLNNEIESQKSYVKRLEDDISNLRKGQQVLQKSKSDVEEAERKTQKENRVLTESIRKLQRQLEETKRYLSIVQSDRNNVHNEKENLRKELHEILNSQRNSNISNNLQTSSTLPSILLVPPPTTSLTFERMNQSSLYHPQTSNSAESLSNPMIVTTKSGNEEIAHSSSSGLGVGVTFSTETNLGIGTNSSNSIHSYNSQLLNPNSGNSPMSATQAPRTRSKSQFMRLQPASPKQLLAEIIPRTSIARIDAPNDESIALDSPTQNDERDNHHLHFNDRQYDDEMVNHDLPGDELSTSFDYVVEEGDEERMKSNRFDHLDYMSSDDDDDDDDDDEELYNEGISGGGGGGGLDEDDGVSSPRNE